MTGNYGDTCPHLGGYCKTRAGTSVLLKQADKARGHETTGGSERRVGSTTQACGRGRRSQLPGLRVGGGQGWRHMRGHGGGCFVTEWARARGHSCPSGPAPYPHPSGWDPTPLRAQLRASLVPTAARRQEGRQGPPPAFEDSTLT